MRGSHPRSRPWNPPFKSAKTYSQCDYQATSGEEFLWQKAGLRLLERGRHFVCFGERLGEHVFAFRELLLNLFSSDFFFLLSLASRFRLDGEFGEMGFASGENPTLIFTCVATL